MYKKTFTHLRNLHITIVMFLFSVILVFPAKPFSWQWYYYEKHLGKV